MARLQPGQTIATTAAVLPIDAGLKPGKYVFRLVVEDSSGNRSRPDEATVVVYDPELESPTILTTDTRILEPIDSTLIEPIFIPIP